MGLKINQAEKIINVNPKQMKNNYLNNKLEDLGY